MKENKQCQQCANYEFCIKRKDNEVCLEFNNMEADNVNITN